MSIDQKQSVEVQFLNFGAGVDGFSVPILSRDKNSFTCSPGDCFVRLTTAAMTVNARFKGPRPAR
jgi:hypothetical protein